MGSANAGRSTIVFEDPAGDAGIEGGTAIGKNSIPGFDLAGLDLVSGQIDRVGDNLEFTVTHSAMPPTGALPEGAAFYWNFEVNGQNFRFTIKSQDVGKLHPLSQQGVERIGRVDVAGHFRLETCEPGGNISFFGWSRCDLIAMEEGSFDPPSKSFTVQIPLDDIGATTGSLIERTGGGSGRCKPCWIMHEAEMTSPPGFVIDGTSPGIVYRIPKN
jgi:hypothetical protein